MEERHKYAKRKKRESSEKRAVLKERHKYATQKKTNMALLLAEIHSRRPRATSAAGICIQNQGPSRQLFW